MRAAAERYLRAVSEAAKTYRRVRDLRKGDDFVTEVSMDETDLPQTPDEMAFILAAIVMLFLDMMLAIELGKRSAYLEGLVSAVETDLAAAAARLETAASPGSILVSEEIHEAVDYGVVKMNIDTDTQYAFSRPVADHVFKNYDGILKVDGEVGNKKVYDPRIYLELAESGMAERVRRAVTELRAVGTTMFKA